MKKLLLILFAGLLLLAACGGEDDAAETAETNEEENNESNAENETDTPEQEEKKEVYTIGDTAVITSDLYEFDYEVTVNDFYFAEEVNGKPMEDIMSTSDDDYKLAVADVTFKNISDEAYVPHQMYSANLSAIDEDGGEISYNEFFPEADEELAPGEEVQGPLVYVERVDYADTFLLKFEFMSDEETHFELPNPEQ
ncbi:DUF4352 domain-containing protein [Oceanobacillus neutriphilus]|uniref:DUF4352 domain-containing protein n=1 Tax=Oceanobacillus neutriphilus TaxID=531815 RepID=A0ABQ2P0Z0_9BACI|nr:DUF4352 domain-containing protein [Oceanobacillus neutriphilus]GGP15560.1 hypothetical protein GCM10011346_43950 [Oceanobacillus neutriphilus]